MESYKFNIVKSPKDRRDYILKNSNLSLPDSLDYRDELQPIRNQGSQGTCYAQATACMKEWQEKKDNGFDEYMSPQFFYNNRENIYDNDTTNDEGMYGRDVMKLIKNIGICKENTYPYGKIESRDKIDIQVYEEAKEYIIESYARIKDLNTLKESLFSNGPCLIALPVYNNNIEFWKKNKNDTFKGGHAMTIVGYNDEGFIIRNSWGSGWGNNGYCLYKYDDWGAHWEIWTTVDLDRNNIYIPSKKCCIIC